MVLLNLLMVCLEIYLNVWMLCASRDATISYICNCILSLCLVDVIVCFFV